MWELGKAFLTDCCSTQVYDRSEQLLLEWNGLSHCFVSCGMCVHFYNHVIVSVFVFEKWLLNIVLDI